MLLAVHVIVPPGASAVGGVGVQIHMRFDRSLVETFCAVTLPSLVTFTSSVRCGFRAIGVVRVSVPATSAPTGGLPDTLTVFTTLAASASARVTTCPEVVVQVIDALGANDVPGQLIPSVNEASVTLTGFKVT